MLEGGLGGRGVGVGLRAASPMTGRARWGIRGIAGVLSWTAGQVLLGRRHSARRRSVLDLVAVAAIGC